MLEEYRTNCDADRKSTAFVDVGVPNFDASVVSVSTLVASRTGPHLKLPTIAPVVDWTFGTTPVKSTSFTVIAGDAEGLKTAMSHSFWVIDKLYHMNIHYSYL
tara:strand:+ start:698 stop:1006 length:309 start_codon:yes stop_codon:yes gene_type:complete